MSAAISLMLQRRPEHLDRKGHYKVDDLIKEAHSQAAQCLETDADVGTLSLLLLAFYFLFFIFLVVISTVSMFFRKQKQKLRQT